MERKKTFLIRLMRCIPLLVLCILLAAGSAFALEKVTIHVDELHQDVELEREWISILTEPEIKSSHDAAKLEGQPFREALVIGVPEGTETIRYEINGSGAYGEIETLLQEEIDPDSGREAVALIYSTEEVWDPLEECALYIEFMDEDGEVFKKLDSSIWWSDAMTDRYTLEGGDWVVNDWDMVGEDDSADLILCIIPIVLMLAGLFVKLKQGESLLDAEADENGTAAREPQEGSGPEPDYSLFRPSEEDPTESPVKYTWKTDYTGESDYTGQAAEPEKKSPLENWYQGAQESWRSRKWHSSEEPAEPSKFRKWKSFREEKASRRSRGKNTVDEPDPMDNPFEVKGHRRRRDNPFEK